MRKLVYILLNMFIQLMSLPFLAFTIMLIVYGMFGIGHYSPFLIFSIVLVILLTTIAFGFYIHILISSYNLMKALYTKQASHQSITQVVYIQRSSLIFSIAMFIALPFVYIFVEYDDSPGLLLLYILLTLFGFVIYSITYLINDYYFNKDEDILTTSNLTHTKE